MSAQQSAPDQTVTLALMCGVLFLIGWLIWHFLKQPILEVLRWVRFVEIWTIDTFTSANYTPCLDWLKNAKYLDTNPSPDMVRWTKECFGTSYLANVPAEDALSYFALSAVAIAAIERGVTTYYHWPLAAIFAALSIYTVYFSPRNKFKTKHNLESFIKTQAKMWPVISPIVNFNPIKSSARIPGTPVPDKLPLFAEALSPEEWISFHRISVTNNIPEREATRRAFLVQLGPRWNGVAGQPQHIQALIAAFALKGVQRREESDDLLGEIAVCWSPSGGLNLSVATASKVKNLLNDPKVGGEALKIGGQHAYRTTAMLAILLWARQRGGVLAPAQFLWLRGSDRTLWYALNNLGRRAFHTEGAAAMAHFMAEQNAKKPLPIPRIDTALVTLNQFLAQFGQPIPPREEAKR
ncbi:MAG: hypothetical protein WAO98_07720 [Alphaproteobacteria bacterium]